MFYQEMHRRNVRMAVVGVIGLTCMSAQADENSEVRGPNLTGDYGFITTTTCVRTDPQDSAIVGGDLIDPHSRQMLVDGEIVDQAGLGVMSFTRGGKVHVRGLAAEFQKRAISAGQTPIHDGLDATCDGTYTLNQNYGMDMTYNCVIDSPSAGIRIAAGPVVTQGFVANAGRSIDLNLKQNVQTLTISLLATGSVVQRLQRVCLQTFSLNKLGE